MTQAARHYLGIEIGGTKLQLGVGQGDGILAGLWRGRVDVAAGPEGIRRQIKIAVPELLSRSSVKASQIAGVGIGFGGPVDDGTQTIIKSHQIEGWDDFKLAAWVSEILGWPVALGNDADVAGLAEALFGAGKGLSPVFYITIGSGIGGGLIINGEIYRGSGRGAAEIGHLMLAGTANGAGERRPLELWASGWSIQRMARQDLADGKGRNSLLLRLVDDQEEHVTAEHVGRAAEEGDVFARTILDGAWAFLAEAICQVIVLLCPRRIILGGGVSLMGERVLFEPLRRLVAAQVFQPFAGCYEIVPAGLGEEVVIHGAVALARKRLAGSA
jgi:glucokinase